MHRLWIALGGLAGLAAVALAAWAAHAASAVLDPPRLAALQSGLALQGWHAAALVAAGLWAERRGGALAQAAAGALALGLILFCAGVYASAIGGVSLGPVAPAGGTLLMLGWALLTLSALKSPRGPRR